MFARSIFILRFFISAFIHYTAIVAELIRSPATIVIFYQFVFDDVEDDEDEPSDFA